MPPQASKSRHAQGPTRAAWQESERRAAGHSNTKATRCPEHVRQAWRQDRALERPRVCTRVGSPDPERRSRGAA